MLMTCEPHDTCATCIRNALWSTVFLSYRNSRKYRVYKMSGRKTYVYCCVPGCESTSRKTPEKYFFVVPNDPDRRRRWYDAARRQNIPSDKGCYRICEDHFNYETDLRNYQEHRLTKARPLLKKNAVPSKFDCQTSKKRREPRISSLQRARKQLVRELIADRQEDNNQDQESCMENFLPCDTIATNSGIFNPIAEDAIIPFTPIKQQQKRGPKPKDVHFRSHGVQVTPRMHQQACSPVKRTVFNAALSPMKISYKLTVDDIFSSSDSDDDFDSDDSWAPDSEDSEDYDEHRLHVKKESLNCTRYFNEKESMTYLGIPSESFFIVDMMAGYISYQGHALQKQDIICLIFRKIKLNLSFKILSHNLGVGESHAITLFHKYLPAVSKMCKTFVKMCHPTVARQTAPLAFWARLKECFIIVDAFEIKIERPGDPEKQAATWSDYKKSNTLKYVVGISPDGTIMFISSGYGGRTSDISIVKDSGLIDALPSGISLLADRGFKGLQAVLQSKGISLIRPPSVEAEKPLTKVEALATKRIAAVRIHVERAIARIREFSILAAHSTIDHSLLDKVDDFVFIACGLVNIQTPLTKI